MKNLVKTALSFAVSLVVVVPAYASQIGSTTRDASPRRDIHIAIQQRTAAPLAHIVFCKASPSECTATANPVMVKLDAEAMRELRNVNQSVNRRIRPVNDAGFDRWSVNPDSGDCDDYAVTKRHDLVKNGWPASALRLAVAFTARGEGHMVLVVKTTEGDLVLDNLTGAVKNWTEAGLKWEMIQSETNPRIWHRI